VRTAESDFGKEGCKRMKRMGDMVGDIIDRGVTEQWANGEQYDKSERKVVQAKLPTENCLLMDSAGCEEREDWQPAYQRPWPTTQVQATGCTSDATRHRRAHEARKAECSVRSRSHAGAFIGRSSPLCSCWD